MQISQTPALIPLAFAATGAKNTISETSLVGITDGAASLPDGFPPLTGTPIGSGGVPPFRADMNGILYAISAWARWQSAGGGVVYSSSFATDTNVGGYPKGARVLRSDGTGYWLNQAENNTSNPDTGGADWVPDFNYGVTAITGLTNANVTLTAGQYAKGVITLAGTLTGNVQIIFPAIAGEWIVANNTTGAYTVTCKTASGSGAALARGSSSLIWGDGANIYATLAGMVWNQLAAVATAASLTPDPTNAGQLKAALDALYASAGIQSVSASVASNAMTIPSATYTLYFRDTTLGSGAATRIIGSAASLVIPSGATLGTVSAVRSSLAVLVLNNAGTLEYAAVNLAGGNDLSETGLISTTAISAGATSANVVYSTTSRTNVAYRVVGRIDSTQATAGAWATAPSLVQGAGGQALVSMSGYGFGQTEQDVTASRALNVTYYNTTSKPIEVTVYAISISTTNQLNGFVNGSQKSWVGVGLSGATVTSTFMVRPDSSYQFTATNCNIVKWTEVR